MRGWRGSKGLIRDNKSRIQKWTILIGTNNNMTFSIYCFSSSFIFWCMLASSVFRLISSYCKIFQKSLMSDHVFWTDRVWHDNGGLVVIFLPDAPAYSLQCRKREWSPATKAGGRVVQQKKSVTSVPEVWAHTQKRFCLLGCRGIHASLSYNSGYWRMHGKADRGPGI